LQISTTTMIESDDEESRSDYNGLLPHIQIYPLRTTNSNETKSSVAVAASCRLPYFSFRALSARMQCHFSCLSTRLFSRLSTVLATMKRTLDKDLGENLPPSFYRHQTAHYLLYVRTAKHCVTTLVFCGFDHGGAGTGRRPLLCASQQIALASHQAQVSLLQ
jgi:hypothetical protein